MKKIFLLGIITMGLNVVAQIPTTPGMYNLTMQHDSVTRKFLLIIPNTYNPANNSPLMFCFHGGNGTIQTFVYDQIDTVNGGREQLFEKADSAGIVLVFPEALFNSLSGGTLWNDDNLYPQTNSPYDDIGYVLHLIDTLSQSLSLDTTRLYAAGFSSGAKFTQFLGSQLPCKFAALVAIAGRTANQVSLTDTTLISFPTPTAPVSVMVVRGKLDAKVPYYGGINFEGANITSAFDDLNYWLNANNCNDSLYTTANMGDTVETRTYYQCTDSVKVKLVTLKYMGHVWPNAYHNVYWNANTEAIDFVIQFNNSNCTTFVGMEEINLLPQILLYPNPTLNEIIVNSNSQLVGSTYIIYDQLGRALMTGKLNSEIYKIDLVNLPAGIYLFSAGENHKQTFKVIKN